MDLTVARERAGCDCLRGTLHEHAMVRIEADDIDARHQSR